MAETTFTITTASIGAVLDPRDGYLQSFRWVGPRPSRYETALTDRGRQNGYLTLKGEDDHWPLISFDLGNPMRESRRMDCRYHGGLLIDCVPFDTTWEIVVSDVPALRKAA